MTHRFIDISHVHCCLQLLHHALSQLGGGGVGIESIAQHLPVGGVLQQQPAPGHQELLHRGRTNRQLGPIPSPFTITNTLVVTPQFSPLPMHWLAKSMGQLHSRSSPPVLFTHHHVHVRSSHQGSVHGQLSRFNSTSLHRSKLVGWRAYMTGHVHSQGAFVYHAASRHAPVLQPAADRQKIYYQPYC